MRDVLDGGRDGKYVSFSTISSYSNYRGDDIHHVSQIPTTSRENSLSLNHHHEDDPILLPSSKSNSNSNIEMKTEHHQRVRALGLDERNEAFYARLRF